jgi:poly(ADP-ribose) glycohydrolase ARH3
MFNKLSIFLQKNKIPNTVLGTCIGDALGVPYEKKEWNSPELLAWDGVSFSASKFHKTKKGEYSDDGQMTIMVAESLIENKRFDPKDLSERYVDWIYSGRARGYGRTTKAAVDNLKNGVHWTKSGIEGSFGNGTAMRVAPFGVFYAKKDFSDMLRAVRIDSAITHRSVEAEAGALTIAIAIYHIVKGTEEDIVRYLAVHLPESEVKRKVLMAYDMVEMETQSVVEPKLIPIKALQIIGTSANVKDTVPAAMYCYWRFNHFNDAVPMAIKGGKDADTTGAIVGALFGAKTKLCNIHSDWVTKVESSSYLRELDTKLST